MWTTSESLILSRAISSNSLIQTQATSSSETEVIGILLSANTPTLRWGKFTNLCEDTLVGRCAKPYRLSFKYTLPSL